MGRSPQELQDHLMATNDEYRHLAAEHASHKRKLEELASRPYLTEQEQFEEIRLKKLKLRLKDEMQSMIHQASSQEVA